MDAKRKAEIFAQIKQILPQDSVPQYRDFLLNYESIAARNHAAIVNKYKTV